MVIVVDLFNETGRNIILNITNMHTEDNSSLFMSV